MVHGNVFSSLDLTRIARKVCTEGYVYRVSVINCVLIYTERVLYCSRGKTVIQIDMYVRKPLSFLCQQGNILQLELICVDSILIVTFKSPQIRLLI